jgi:uncharacterized protein
LSDLIIRRASISDYQDIIVLNQSEVQFTSPMDLERLKLLDSLSSYHRVAIINNQAAGFILVMKDHAAYVNDNFNWFSLRYEDFLYVDRIVVGKDYQDCGVGSLLYEDLFSFARHEKIKIITCEININPPNEKSLAFHHNLGFQEVGSQFIDHHKKQVSMQVKLL